MRNLDPARIRSELLDALDPYQQDAVVCLDGPLLVVAGPGSGKTRVLTHRLAALTDAGVWPSKMLAVTFTNKAAKEMKERLAGLIGPEEADRATVSTFHSMCARILRTHHEAAGLPRAFTILDSDDSARVVARVCASAGLTAGMQPAEVRTIAKKTHAAISRAKNAGLTAQQLAASPVAADRRTGEMMAAYDQLMRQMGAVDFDDLLLAVLRLLQNNADVAAALQARWSHVSVDEFQDTNDVQYAILTHLVAGHRNLCVVGDADQSIYAFRGARPSVVNAFTDDYAEARVVVLERNYRSTGTICAVSKAVIAPNEATFRASQEPAAGPGEKARLTGYASDRDEARAIVAEIAMRGGPLREHAVLVRTNALTRSVEQELNRSRMAYDVVGTLRFVERAEIKDALAWLAVAVNPANQVAFDRSVSVPRRGIGNTTAAKVREIADEQGCAVLAAADHLAQAGSGKQAASLAEYVDLVGQVATAAAIGGPGAAVRVIDKAVGLRQVVLERDRKEGTDRAENLDQLIDMADSFTAPAGSDAQAATEAFTEMLALASEEDEHDAATDRVQILTMHAAKGKEFDHVYVIGCEEQVLPHSRALDEGEEEIAEERRLFFVATSRARVRLDLSWCAQRMRFGKVEAALPSRFLDDIPRDLLKVVDPPSPTSWNTGGSTWGSGARHGGQRYGSQRTGTRAGSRPTLPKHPTGPARTAPRRTVSTLDPARVSAGTRVRHAKFGLGTVRGVRPDSTAEVAFDDGRTRLLMLTLAPLEIA